MSFQFKRILIYSIQGKSVDVVKAVIDWLQSRLFQVSIYKETASLMNITHVPQLGDDDIKNNDLMVVIGGDGSMLSAANKAVHYNVPILGINTGKLGFLVDHNPGDFSGIEAVLKGDYLEERRTLLSIKHGEKQALAMNEVFISRQEVGKIMSLTMLINDESVCQYSADGLIIATPSGSTAHAMSAGGTILHPESNSFIVIPVCPHKLNSRPIVIPEHEKITIQVCDNDRVTPCISSDGREAEKINNDDKVQIQAFSEQVRLIHQSNYSFYATLKQKLHWEKILDA